MSNKRKKKYTSVETLQILSNHGKCDYVTSYDAQETKAFNGDIVFDASRGGSKYRLPLHLMMFGDFIYDDSNELLNVVLPKTLVCSGDLIVKSCKSLQVGQNYSLRANFKNAVIDFMGADSNIGIGELLCSGTVVLKNYNGSSFPNIEIVANKLVLVDCPNLNGIDREHLNHNAEVTVENCPNMFDRDGCLIDSELHLDVHNISEFANKSELVALEEISIDLDNKYQAPNTLRCNHIKITNSILPEVIDVTINSDNFGKNLQVTDCKSISGSSLLKVNIVGSDSDVAKHDKINISGSEIASIETNINEVINFIADNAKLAIIPDSIQKIYKLNVRNTPISKLPDTLKVNILDICGTEITYLPNVFHESGYVTINADFDKLSNAICHKLPFNGKEEDLVMFMHDGQYFVTAPHNTHNQRYIFGLEDYFKLLYSDNMYYTVELIHFMEEHLSQAKMDLKRKLRKLKCSANVVLKSI